MSTNEHRVSITDADALRKLMRNFGQQARAMADVASDTEKEIARLLDIAASHRDSMAKVAAKAKKIEKTVEYPSELAPSDSHIVRAIYAQVNGTQPVAMSSEDLEQYFIGLADRVQDKGLVETIEAMAMVLGDEKVQEFGKEATLAILDHIAERLDGIESKEQERVVEKTTRLNLTEKTAAKSKPVKKTRKESPKVAKNESNGNEQQVTLNLSEEVEMTGELREALDSIDNVTMMMDKSGKIHIVIDTAGKGTHQHPKRDDTLVIASTWDDESNWNGRVNIGRGLQLLLTLQYSERYKAAVNSRIQYSERLRV